MKLLFKYITFSIGSLSVSLLILLTSIKPLGAELEIQPEVLFEQGVNLGESGNYQSAIDIFTQVIILSPFVPEPYYNRGLSFERLNQFQRAIADYNQTLQLDPEYIPAYLNRGNLYSLLDDHQRAINDFTRAINLDPNYYRAYYNRGNSFFYIGEYQKAIADYNQTLILNPHYYDAIYNRGLTHYQMGNLDSARKDLFHAARAYLHRNDKDSYLEALERIEELELSTTTTSYIPPLLRGARGDQTLHTIKFLPYEPQLGRIKLSQTINKYHIIIIKK
ncbi:MAG: tetratricopeptide repeat protein [Cyanobacterium sp.]